MPQCRSSAQTAPSAGTNSMKWSPWEAPSVSACQEISHILWNLHIHYHVHKSPPFDPILSQIDTAYTPSLLRSSLKLPSHLCLDLFKCFLIIKPTRCTNFSNLFWKWNSTCFRQFLCPSSGVIQCTLSNGICHTDLQTAFKQDQDGTAMTAPSWSCSKIA
jgi:hypothetical protein